MRTNPRATSASAFNSHREQRRGCLCVYENCGIGDTWGWEVDADRAVSARASGVCARAVAVCGVGGGLWGRVFCRAVRGRFLAATRVQLRTPGPTRGE